MIAFDFFLSKVLTEYIMCVLSNTNYTWHWHVGAAPWEDKVANLLPYISSIEEKCQVKRPLIKGLHTHTYIHTHTYTHTHTDDKISIHNPALSFLYHIYLHYTCLSIIYISIYNYCILLDVGYPGDCEAGASAVERDRPGDLRHRDQSLPSRRHSGWGPESETSVAI